MDEDFFEQVDSFGIVELHIQRVLKLEDQQAKQLLERYKSVRYELRDRLSRTRAGTFTSQQLRGVLTQIEAAISAMTTSLKDRMGSAALTLAEAGVDDLLSELAKFEDEFTGAVVPINLNAQIAALDTRNFLLTQYESSIDAYGSDLISQLVGNLTQSSLMEASYGEVVTNLDQFFMGEEWKLHRIARTELHNIYNIGKMNGMSELVGQEILPDLKKALMHPMDARTGDDSKYLAVKNPIVPINEPFEYRWHGKLREFMAPPDRPNDRAILIPVRDSWGTDQPAGFFPGRR